MKRVLMIALVFSSLAGNAQTVEEQQLTTLSRRIFGWEVAGNMDSLAGILHDQFMLMSSAGMRQTRGQYIARLTDGTFVHNAIDIQESSATIASNTGLVMGKGQFTITSNGQHSVLLLAYTEVFTRTVSGNPWKLLAIHANPLPASTH